MTMDKKGLKASPASPSLPPLSSPSSKDKNGLDRDLFIDIKVAGEFVCPVCLCVPYEPLEHIPRHSKARCPYVFCIDCAKDWIKSESDKNGNQWSVSCPNRCSSGIFSMDNLRPLGPRERNRLHGLLVKCLFQCGERVTYERYQGHKKVCSMNPANLCCNCGYVKESGHLCPINRQEDPIKQLEANNRTLGEEVRKLEQQVITLIDSVKTLEDKNKDLKATNEECKKRNDKLVEMYRKYFKWTGLPGDPNDLIEEGDRDDTGDDEDDEDANWEDVNEDRIESYLRHVLFH